MRCLQRETGVRFADPWSKSEISGRLDDVNEKLVIVGKIQTNGN